MPTVYYHNIIKRQSTTSGQFTLSAAGIKTKPTARDVNKTVKAHPLPKAQIVSVMDSMTYKYDREARNQNDARYKIVARGYEKATFLTDLYVLVKTFTFRSGKTPVEQQT